MLNPDVMLLIGLFIGGLLIGALLVYWLMQQRANALLAQNHAEFQLHRQELETRSEHLQEKLGDIQQRLTVCEQSEESWQRQCYEQQNKVTQLQQRITHYQELEQVLKAKEGDIAELQTALKEEHGRCAELQAKLQASRHELTEKITLLKEAKEQLKLVFQNIANKLFEDKSERFTSQNKTNMEQILNPLREQLTDFKRRVEDVYDKESKERVSLLKEITTLKDINSRMSEDAIKLTKALKGDTKIQGNWGEMVLERILETSGLRKGIEYETQVSLKEESGERRQPDVVVRLPEEKDIVIDAKVSLVAWESYCSAETDEARDTALVSLLQSIKEHVRQLSGKSYSHLEGIRSLDFVLMFVPVEGAFLKVLEMNSELFNEAFDKNIMVVSPSTLLVTLRTIQNIWRYEYQNRNTLEIAKAAGGLHDQFVLFTEALEDIGTGLTKTQLAYDTAYKRLTSGRGNLVRRTVNLEKLGAKAKKKLPSHLVEESDDWDDATFEDAADDASVDDTGLDDTALEENTGSDDSATPILEKTEESTTNTNDEPESNDEKHELIQGVKEKQVSKTSVEGEKQTQDKKNVPDLFVNDTND